MKVLLAFLVLALLGAVFANAIDSDLEASETHYGGYKGNYYGVGYNAQPVYVVPIYLVSKGGGYKGRGRRGHNPYWG